MEVPAVEVSAKLIELRPVVLLRTIFAAVAAFWNSSVCPLVVLIVLIAAELLTIPAPTIVMSVLFVIV